MGSDFVVRHYRTRFEECSQSSSTVSNIFVTYKVKMMKLGLISVWLQIQNLAQVQVQTLEDDLQLDTGGVGGQIQVVELILEMTISSSFLYTQELA